jgi:hypothetical protein
MDYFGSVESVGDVDLAPDADDVDYSSWVLHSVRTMRNELHRKRGAFRTHRI